MSYILYGLTGVLGGILGGMGMGGGTVLIPLLSIFFGIGQHACQAINLISFIPMSVISLLIHFKNKLVDTKGVINIIVFGLVSCFVASYVAKSISGDLLRRIFGGFLIALAVYVFYSGIRSKSK